MIKVKEEIIKSVIENRMENISVVGITLMTSRNKILQKSVTEVIRIKDRADRCGDHVQHKYGEK